MRRLLPCLIACALCAPALAADRQVEALRRELAQLSRSEQEGQGEAERQRARLAALNAGEVEIRRRIERNRGQLARLLGALQMHSRHPPPPLLVNPRSAKDAVRAAILIRAITPELEARRQGFAAEAEAIARIRREAATAAESLFQTESEVADRRAEMQRLLGEAGARAGSVGELVDVLPPAAGPGAGSGMPARFVTPVRGTVGRRFGAPQPGRGRAQGWTWRAAPSAPVLSPAAGRVEYAGPLKGWGTVVILRLGGGWRVVLAGLEGVGVDVGRQVAAGEPLGRMGPGAPPPRPGASPTAPELYLEVRNQANPVDPARWLNTRTTG